MTVLDYDIDILYPEIKLPSGDVPYIRVVKPVLDVPKEILIEEPTETQKQAGQLFVEGYIRDKETGDLLNDATIQVVVNATREPLTDIVHVTNNEFYYAYTDVTNRHTNSVKFTAPGYEDLVVQFSILEKSPDVFLTKSGKSFPWWYLLIIAGAVLTYKKKTGKVGAFSTADLFPIFLIAGGLVSFSLIQEILERLGLWDSKDTKELDASATNPDSPWNPNFWKTVLPKGKSYTYTIDTPTAMSWSNEIYEAVGPINDCEECIKAVLKRCRTQANASFLCYVFDAIYSHELLDFLRGGNWPQDRLSDSDVNEINKYILNLPKY